MVKPKEETVIDNREEGEIVPDETVELPFAVRERIAMTTPEELA